MIQHHLTGEGSKRCMQPFQFLNIIPLCAEIVWKHLQNAFCQESMLLQGVHHLLWMIKWMGKGPLGILQGTKRDIWVYDSPLRINGHKGRDVYVVVGVRTPNETQHLTPHPQNDYYFWQICIKGPGVSRTSAHLTLLLRNTVGSGPKVWKSCWCHRWMVRTSLSPPAKMAATEEMNHSGELAPMIPTAFCRSSPSRRNPLCEVSSSFTRHF